MLGKECGRHCEIVWRLDHMIGADTCLTVVTGGNRWLVTAIEAAVVAVQTNSSFRSE
jgi:hypothetical protein